MENFIFCAVMEFSVLCFLLFGVNIDIQRKTTCPEVPFDKVATIKPAILFKKDSGEGVAVNTPHPF